MAYLKATVLERPHGRDRSIPQRLGRVIERFSDFRNLIRDKLPRKEETRPVLDVRCNSSITICSCIAELESSKRSRGVWR